ncbi:MAG: hypothetical protein F6K58_11575 [Symploca sp. SIO2E9]|nr:hypothetical protein [Symploca sp. SIO2E9]
MSIQGFAQAIRTNVIARIQNWNDPNIKANDYYSEGIALANRGNKQRAIKSFEQAKYYFKAAGNLRRANEAKAKIDELKN